MKSFKVIKEEKTRSRSHQLIQDQRFGFVNRSQGAVSFFRTKKPRNIGMILLKKKAPMKAGLMRARRLPGEKRRLEIKSGEKQI